MPIDVGEVRSDVSVEGGADPHGGAGAPRHELPEAGDLARWEALRRRLELDAARTRACGFDDGYSR